MKGRPYIKYFVIVLLAIILDQSTKLLVYFNMEMGSAGQIKILGDWFKLHYTLNPGMAFGIQFGFKYGKILLTLGRIFATIFIFDHIYKESIKSENYSKESLFAWSFIAGGAIGNVIDCIFYGVYLGNAPYLSPFKWLHGQVIDMILIDLYSIRMPDWVPYYGGLYYRSFPIFNIADCFITLGVSMLLIKNWKKKVEN